MDEAAPAAAASSVIRGLDGVEEAAFDVPVWTGVEPLRTSAPTVVAW